MFICSTTKGKDYAEGEEITLPDGKKKKLTWDDVPSDAELTVLQLLYPFPVRFKNVEKSATPKLTISGFNKYYFYNESTVPMLVTGSEIIRTGVASLEAKVIAGIDEKADMVLEFRMDKWGNCTVRKQSYKALKRQIKDKAFRAETLRSGK